MFPHESIVHPPCNVLLIRPQVPGGPVLASALQRRRPPEGWSYMVEELGEEGRRGVQGGKRFVVAPDGSQRTLTPLEKMFVEREKTLPRRRSIPR